MSTEETPTDSGSGRKQAIEQIVTLLGINGGVAPARVEEFWYQLALTRSVGIPADGMINMAKQIFAKLEEEWDDDYLTEDGEDLSLEAYETLYELLQTAPSIDASPSDKLEAEDEGADEEDDSIGSVGLAFDSRAETTQTDVDTTLNKIAKGGLILNPDWQRNFVWKLKKQRRLIESMLLGLPIPSLLLFRDSKTGKTYVIDGRQRLETISRFREPKNAKGEVRKRFRTFSPKTEGWRPDEKLHVAANKYYADLPDEFKSKFDSTTLVLHTFVDLPADKLYQIFRRYNTGAEQLKAAEIRNAVYQASPLHEMMYRLAGEDGADEITDEAERSASTLLRSIMKNKTARYGAYDFVGRYFAFSNMGSGSVANATNDFMVQFENSDADALRMEFVRVIQTTRTWYEYPLVTPSDEGKFHAFLATVQTVSTKRMLEYLDAGLLDETELKRYIKEHWRPFAEEILSQKQNSTAFWSRQKEWEVRLKEHCVKDSPA